MAKLLRLLAFSSGATATTAVLLIAAATGQEPGGSWPPGDDRSPAGKMKRSQVEEMLKADRAKSIEDAGQLIKLSEELKTELEKTDKSVLSVPALRKAEEIEKLAKRIRGRLRRF